MFELFVLIIVMELEFETGVISIRCRKIKTIGRKLGWCCGVLLANSNGCEHTIPSVKIRDQVDVLFESSMTQGLDDTTVFAREMSLLLGKTTGSRIVEFRCERREKPLNQRGAVVLHAVEYLGVTLTEGSDSESDDDDDSDNHNHSDKTNRHAIFAAWLNETFGSSVLTAGNGVLDVAAGKGLLSIELCKIIKSKPSSGKLNCTLVEPEPRKCHIHLPKQTRLIPDTFDEKFMEKHEQFLHGISIVIGLHPDQATDSIVDCALRFNKPFAIMPCCVYPTLFPDRRLSMNTTTSPKHTLNTKSHKFLILIFPRVFKYLYVVCVIAHLLTICCV